jgi:hypothetical protein
MGTTGVYALVCLTVDGGRGGRGRSDQSYQGSNTNRTTSGVSATNTNSIDSANTTNVPADQSVVSEISERGSQNGRGSAVALTTPDSKRPRVHERYVQSFQVHGARALNKSTSKKPSLATLPTMKSTTMLTPRVLARIGDLWNFLANIALCHPFRRHINRHSTSR